MKQHFQNTIFKIRTLQMVIWITCCMQLHGQKTVIPTSVDTFFLSAEMTDFLEKNQLLPDNLPIEDAYLEELKSKFKQLQKPKTPNTQVNFNQYYFLGDTLYNSAIPANLYSQIHTSTKVQVGNMPLFLSGQLVALDGKIDVRLSFLNVGFDAGEWQENLREKYLLPDNWEDAKQALNLSPEELKVLKEQLQFDTYRQITAQARFAQLKAEAQHQVDTLLSSQMDSLVTNHTDTLALKKWQKTVQTIQKIEQTYQKLWNIRQDFSPYAVLQDIKKRTQKLQNKWEALANPDSLRHQLLSNDSLKLKEKWLTLTKDFQIGQFGLDDNEYTAQYLALNGIHYGFEGKRLYGEMAWGNQALNASFLPNLGSLLISRYQGNRFFFLKTGIGEQGKNYGEVSVLRAKTHPTDSTTILPRENLVIATSAARNLNDFFKLETNIALSQHDVIQLSPTDVTAISARKRVAFELLNIYEPKSSFISIGMGYFYVGTAFKTLGNPFLLTGRQGLRVDIKTQFLKKKLSVNLSGKYGWNTNEQQVTNDFIHLQLRGEARLRLGRQNQISVRFMPNTFQQFQEEQVTATSKNTIYSVQGLFFHQLGKRQLSSIIHLTNLDSDFQLSDTLTTDKRLYLYVQEALQLTERQSIQATLLLGSQDITSINDFLIQLDYRFPISKAMITGGGQVLQSPFEDTVLYGLLLQLQIPVSKYGTLSLQSTWRHDFLSTHRIQHLFGNLSFSLSI